jgi:hypothetical protein
MSDAEPQAETEQTAVASRPLDRDLLAEAKRYGVPYAAYADMSVRERGAVRQRWEDRLRAEAKRRKINPDVFVDTTEEDREGLRAQHPETVRSRRKATIAPVGPAMRTLRDVAERVARDEEDAPPLPAAPPPTTSDGMYDPSLTDGDDGETHSPMDDVPAPEIDPRRRDKATIGVITPVDEDLVGWKQPRNLRDVYARYTIGDGQHFVRVERLEPKVWHQIPCSGYLGDIREPISEPEFHSWYGGRVYMLTVYGPDPRGRQDPATGMPIIKAKTEPFRYTVPMLPPNLAVPPGTNPTKLGDESMHPFQMMSGGAGQPLSPADAQVHKSTLDFFSTQLQRSEDEKKELRRTVLDGGGSKAVLDVVSESNRAALEQARLNAESERRAAEVREKTLQEQIIAKDKEVQKLSEKVERLAEQQNAGRANPVKDTVELMQASNPGKNAEEQVSRMREMHKEEMDRLRDGHKDAISALKERHDDERKRLQERLTEVESRSTEKLNDLERRGRDREKELRDQMDQQRRDEREAADRRVKETVDRFEDRMKDMRSQHERELRMQESQHVTRTDTSKTSIDMQIATYKEKIAKLEEDLEEAQEEAEKSKDPVQVMAKAKEQAEAMGYEKPEDEPKTGWDRFLSTAGMGLGKAFETVDQWLPKALGARGEAAAQQAAGRALPAGAAAPQQQRPAPRPAPRRPPVAWATTGSVPVANQRATMPAADPVMQAAPPVQAAPPPMAQASTPPPAPQPTPAPEQAPPQQNGHAEGAAPNAVYGTVFPDEIIVQFRAEIERALTSGMPPEVFAQRFVKAFSEASAILVQAHKPEEFIEVVKRMPNGIESNITRRDGKRWVEKMWQETAARHQPQQQGASA